MGSVSRTLFSPAGFTSFDTQESFTQGKHHKEYHSFGYILNLFFWAAQIYFPCQRLMGKNNSSLFHSNHAANSYGRLLCCKTYSTILSPAVCFPTASCSRQYSQGGGQRCSHLGGSGACQCLPDEFTEEVVHLPPLLFYSLLPVGEGNRRTHTLNTV